MLQLTPKEARLRLGWSLNDAEAHSGVNKSTISRLERGIVRPTYDTVLALLKAYRLKPGALRFPKAA
jgi:transcriptional regulator with XRE-family HTH domain